MAERIVDGGNVRAVRIENDVISVRDLRWLVRRAPSTYELKISSGKGVDTVLTLVKKGK